MSLAGPDGSVPDMCSSFPSAVPVPNDLLDLNWSHCEPGATAIPLSHHGPAQGRHSDRAPANGMCQVCTVVPYQFHHFGAFVCNRCRAFFRRTVRRGRRGVPVTDCLTTKQPHHENFR